MGTTERHILTSSKRTRFNIGKTIKRPAVFVIKSVVVVAVGSAAVGFIHGAYDAAVGNERTPSFKASQSS